MRRHGLSIFGSDLSRKATRGQKQTPGSAAESKGTMRSARHIQLPVSESTELGHTCPNNFLGYQPMNAPARSKRHTESAAQKKAHAKSRAKKSEDFVVEYKKYFIAPPTTPDAFRIFDLTDGSGISYSSHT